MVAVIVVKPHIFKGLICSVYWGKHLTDSISFTLRNTPLRLG